jgi:pyoverdine/dityrosine biosynthesis protein Dit1
MINQIMNIFEQYRMAPTPIDQYQQTGKAILEQKIMSYVANNETINFVMLGFPFKSTNSRDKVLGILPDKAEEVTLMNFQQFNEQIKTVYPPGVNITMVSDGYVFNDILYVHDKLVEAYQDVSMDMGRDAPMTWYNLQDFYSGRSLANKREKLISHFGVTPEKLEQDILMNPDVNYLYRGMIRFMDEELADKPYDSGNQLHKAAKKLAREMMFRNEAYSNLVRKEFPQHIRLSMHPSVNNGAKYSFQLIPGGMHSAWHCTVVESSGKYFTMHKKDALAQGYKLIYKDNRPYYFKN